LPGSNWPGWTVPARCRSPGPPRSRRTGRDLLPGEVATTAWRPLWRPVLLCQGPRRPAVLVANAVASVAVRAAPEGSLLRCGASRTQGPPGCDRWRGVAAALAGHAGSCCSSGRWRTAPPAIAGRASPGWYGRWCPAWPRQGESFGDEFAGKVRFVSCLLTAPGSTL